MERIGDTTGAERLENLRIPLTADGREICLLFLSKGDCVISCTLSHAPVRRHNQDLVIRYIRVTREAMDTYQKQKVDGGRDQGPHGGHWDRSGSNVQRKLEGQHNGTAQDWVAEVVEVETVTTAEAAVRKGAMVQTPTPLHQDGQKIRSVGQTGQEGGRPA